MNAAIEIHDSELTAIVVGTDQIAMRLNAYVHKSPGQPGRAPGSGWSQEVEIVFFGAQIETPLPEMPCVLDDGCLSGGVSSKNLIPLPLVSKSLIQFEAYTLEGNRILIRGSGVELQAVGEATYMEEFPGMAP